MIRVRLLGRRWGYDGLFLVVLRRAVAWRVVYGGLIEEVHLQLL
jgi:hypothetical protein